MIEEVRLKERVVVRLVRGGDESRGESAGRVEVRVQGEWR